PPDVPAAYLLDVHGRAEAARVDRRQRLGRGDAAGGGFPLLGRQFAFETIAPLDHLLRIDLAEGAILFAGERRQAVKDEGVEVPLRDALALLVQLGQGEPRLGVALLRRQAEPDRGGRLLLRGEAEKVLSGRVALQGRLPVPAGGFLAVL